MNISATHVYQLKISGPLDDEFVESYCPAGTTLSFDGSLSLLSGIRTDQSGLIGLLRQLHNLGCSILQVNSDQILCDPVEPMTKRNE
jgi:hypothetical protein